MGHALIDQNKIAVLEMQNLKLRSLLQSFVIEFSDYHYNGCPGDTGGKCDCFAGALLDRAKTTLGHP